MYQAQYCPWHPLSHVDTQLPYEVTILDLHFTEEEMWVWGGYLTCLGPC